MRTKLSTKGQVILPKAIREKRHLKAGMEFDVEDRPEGILLKCADPKKKYTIDDLVGIAKYSGRRRSVEEMNAAIEAETRRRFARGRY
jgi:AbrB family looped-hinge helix DNA binding protein